MSDGGGVGGRDEPARGGDDHAELLSELDSHDIAVATTPVAATEVTVFDADAGSDPDGTFPQSVASGGPTPEGVILWTRVAPGAFDPDEPLGVQVARDEAMADPVYEGVVTDTERIRAHDYTVKVDLDGRLDPGEAYHYRFVYGGVPSRVGRCRTLPGPDDSPGSVRLAVLACQNYLNGYYPAYHHVAAEDVDFLVHVGDFIYESDGGHFKGLGSHEYPGREKSLPSGHDRVHTLEDTGTSTGPTGATASSRRPWSRTRSSRGGTTTRWSTTSTGTGGRTRPRATTPGATIRRS